MEELGFFGLCTCIVWATVTVSFAGAEQRWHVHAEILWAFAGTLTNTTRTISSPIAMPSNLIAMASNLIYIYI